MARVLSVEDDGDFQQLLGATLRRHGFEVYYAFDGEEGYEKALAVRPDLILLDMMLPLANGAEVLSRMRRNPALQETPVVVVTAHFNRLDFLERKVRKLGAVAYLRKPVRIDEFLPLARRILGARRAAPSAREVARAPVRFDPGSRAVWIEDRLVGVLTPRRAQLLAALLEAPGEVARERLIARVWRGRANKNALEKAVQRLRQALGPEGSALIVTTESGYRFLDGPIARLAQPGPGGRSSEPGPALDAALKNGA